ncbi:KPN_02809 family neutral zinc metallopeptidase [Oricola cellulosilytica]|uniref:Flagellar biosynthesis protein FlgM n=1 Tax=Oricola cellulosilytica TaxID=1429082 RepID=A0A4R0P2B6_9HYPH|nr:neutral zinc metallopeptidase [Oricola cellulosilytica]TCD10966.1 flagellar biosynthesis protein FlgM [Oricola cellulosilytica]
MRWRGRRQSGNIQDMRGRGSGRSIPIGFPRSPRVRIPSTGRMIRTGGGSLSGIVMMVVLFFVLKACGIDPLLLLDQAGGGASYDRIAPQTQRAPAGPVRNDETTQFVATVLAETEDVWDGVFQANGKNYPKPTLVLFEDQVRSACGFASAATGPFYCPGDRRVYIDLGFFDQLARRFEASGDFAQAYVLAHEVGHHVQNVIGVLPEFNRMRGRMSQAEENAMSVRVELQADCFAGVWGHFTAQKGLLEAGDLQEALNAATQIGDDAIQRRTQGYVVPESFNHGTSEQRRTWFTRGFESGRLEDCDTFNNPV